MYRIIRIFIYPLHPVSLLDKMPKIKSYFSCQSCGYQSTKWMGRGPECGEWNTFVEEREDAEDKTRWSGEKSGAVKPIPISEIESCYEKKLISGIAEFDRVLGGGIVPGSLILIGGDPGIGKSTLMLQTAIELAQLGAVLYVSGEESPAQIKMRADRLAGEAEPTKQSTNQLFLLTETNLDAILQHIQSLAPRVLIIDSIQTVYDPAVESSAGSVTQLRECADRFRQLAKSSGLAIFLIGHVTKEGIIAGPRLLEHMVDTVLYLEGDRFQSYRLLRAVKNRFGATEEVGVFEMLGGGVVEVPNPSEPFLAERVVNASGSAIAVTLEGTRPLLVEVQGLTSPTAFGNPRR